MRGRATVGFSARQGARGPRYFRRLTSSDQRKGTSYLCFVHVAPGLEELLAKELGALVAGRLKRVEGGVEVRLQLEELQLVCSCSRLAEGVRVRLKPFRAFTFLELERDLAALPFRAYLSPGAIVTTSVVCHRSRLYHSGAVRERLENVLRDKVGAKVAASDEGETLDVGREEHAQGAIESSDSPSSRLFVRLLNDEVQVSVDAVGDRLHRRGYRKLSEKASLRETLASAMILALCGSEGPSGVLWDPFCGAGTIALEALARSRGGIAQPGRHFAFHDWPALTPLDPEALERAVLPEALRASPPARLSVIASDINPRALHATRENLNALAERFDWAAREHAELLEGDIAVVESSIPRGAFIVTNPPYGHRLEAAPALKKLTELLARRPDLRPCAVLVGGETKRRLPQDFRVLFQTQNGGLNVAFRKLS
jgi:putative N6-adenine-specific DNA methylase